MYGPEIQSSFWQRTMKVPGGCIFWTGQYNRKSGYGIFHMAGRYRMAHRVALELRLGRPISEGQWALHKCNKKPCVNPNHLYEGSASQNNFDTWESGKKYKVGPDKRKALLKAIGDGVPVPAACKKFGVKRNWYADHKRLVRLGRRKES